MRTQVSKKRPSGTIRNPTQSAAKELRHDSETPWPIAVQQKLDTLANRVSNLEAQIEKPEVLFRGTGISPASIRDRLEQCEARLSEVEAGNAALVAQLLPKEG